MKSHAFPKFTQQKKLDETIGMWFFMTGSSFMRIEKVKKEVFSVVNSPLENVCITSDGWFNVLHNPAVNYMVITGGKSLFLECQYTGGQGHTAEWITEDTIRCMSTIDSGEVILYFQYHHIEKAALNAKQNAGNVNTLKTAGATRWGLGKRVFSRYMTMKLI